MRKINTDLPEFIWQSSIVPLIDKINEVNEDSEISWNSWGGATGAGQLFIDFLNTKTIKVNANVSGYVASMGTAILAFFDNVKGALQADVMIHSVDGGVKSTRRHTNEFLYSALALKIDEAKFKEVTGYELKTVMLAEDEERVNVWMTGKQAGYVGLFDQTYDLLDKAASIKGKVNINELGYELPENIAIKYGLKENQIKSNEMEIKDVTVNMLKTSNLDVYNSVLEEGKKAEQTRVTEIMEYAKYDMQKANEIVKSGKELTKQDVAYFIEKKFNSEKLDSLEKNSEKDLYPAKQTGIKENLTKEQSEKKAALDELAENVGLGKYIDKK